MTYRPRGVCSVCGVARHGAWSGDVIVLGPHRSGADVCDGTGRPAAEASKRRVAGRRARRSSVG